MKLALWRSNKLYAICKLRLQIFGQSELNTRDLKRRGMEVVQNSHAQHLDGKTGNSN